MEQLSCWGGVGGEATTGRERVAQEFGKESALSGGDVWDRKKVLILGKNGGAEL